VLRTFSVNEICRILAGEQHANCSVKIKLQKIRQTGFSQFVAVWRRDRKPTHPPPRLGRLEQSSYVVFALCRTNSFGRNLTTIWGKGRMFYIVRKDKCVCALKSFWICDKSVDRNLCFGSDTVTKSLAFTYVNFCLFICKQWTETLIVSGQAL